jgi:hypothetical protein
METGGSKAKDSQGRGRGVLTVAFGHRDYARMAITMARAIRIRDSETPLAVATDLAPECFQGWFQYVVPWRHAYASFYEFKFDLYAMSPFEETLFIDSDCLALRPIRAVMDVFAGHDVSVAGQNVPSPWWFLQPNRIRERLPRETYPGFNGGLMYFRRSPAAEQVFRRACEWVAEYDALGIARLSSGAINDEPMFSLAMAERGCRAVSNAEHQIMYGPRRGRVDIDIMAGTCEMDLGGRVVQPMTCHFVGMDKDRYVYERERLRMQAAGRFRRMGRSMRAVIDGAARLTWLWQRIVRRGRQLRRRRHCV